MGVQTSPATPEHVGVVGYTDWMNESEVAGMVVAAESHGLVTRKDALGFLTRRQLKRRLGAEALVEVCPRVYRFVGAPQTWMQSLVAIQTWDKRTVFSHRTAAALHGFELFKEGPLEVTSRLKVRAPDGLTVHRGLVLPSQITQVNDLPATKIPRTLIDLMSSTDWYTMKTTLNELVWRRRRL